MKIGTKSVLFGAHCFLFHWFFVFLGWWKLYGFPFDPRLWVAFFVHDIGYIGKPNMDGIEGESHPEVGALIMSELFDYPCRDHWAWGNGCVTGCSHKWYDFVLYHSRYYAKRHGRSVSRLCFADKMAFILTPRWLYLPMVTATGELEEYLDKANVPQPGNWNPPGRDKYKWYAQLKDYMQRWIDAHKSGELDTWTDPATHTST